MDISHHKLLYTASEIQKIDELVIQSNEHTGLSLMARAARASFEVLTECWPVCRRIQVFCGIGKNGGDGYLLAALALSKGWEALVWQVDDVVRMKGDAALAREQALKQGVTEYFYKIGSLQRGGGVIVDAMLGTGFAKKLRSSYKDAVLDINESGLPVLALDLPTGLNADTGEIIDEVVRAHQTITFIGKKRGLLTASGPDCVGMLTLDTLGLSLSNYNTFKPRCFELNFEELLVQLENRKHESHKGTFGSVLIIGGNHAMGGAVALAGEAALRTGAGLVRVLTRKEHMAPILARTPELMVQDPEEVNDLDFLISQSDIVLIGPGLGQDSWAQNLLCRAIEVNVPIILDADALNLIREKQFADLQSRDTLMTPHPGEAARLLGCSSIQVQRDRFKAAQRMQEEFGGVLVLKGNGTIVYDGDNFMICSYGNPGMATAGMGDILGGVIASFLAQGFSKNLAASLAVCLHAAAADKVCQNGMRGMTASDVILPMRELLG